MALQSVFPEARGSQRSASNVVVVTVDRARSFRQARRHTWFVRVMRLALPVVAVASFASYTMGVGLKFKAGSGTVSTGPVAVSTENLTMSNPRYEGFNKDGSKYDVTAKTATQDLRNQGPVGLNEIEGRLVQANQSVIKLTSKRGSFDNKSSQLELMDEIKIRGEDGMRADLARATLFLKENRIVSKEPVALDMTAGQIRANEMELLQSSRQVIFSNGVRTRLKPEQKPAATKPGVAATGAGANRMIGASDAPVDIDSQTLRIDDNKKTAVFTGDVLARQGEATLRTRELEAYYEGVAVTSVVAQPTTATGATPAVGKLTRLVSKGDVVLTNGADRVTSNSADFDAVRETALLQGNVVMVSGADRRAISDRAELDSKADTALLTGSVVVTQDRNVLRGNRLALDRKAGTTRLTSPADAGVAAGRIAAKFYQAASTVGKAAALKPESASGGAPTGLVFRTDPNAPIDIDAETLDVSDKAKTAIFRGAVRAVQGEVTIKTVELIATYSGEAGLAAAGGPTDAKQTAAQLQKVRANQQVEVTSSNNQSATGDWAEFDVKANKVVIGGKVALKDGFSVAYGQRAIIDMTTGITYMERETRVSGPVVSPSPTEQRTPAAAYRLPELPAVKPAVVPATVPAFDADPNACPPGRTCIRFDPKSSVGAKAGVVPKSTTAKVPSNAAPATSPSASGWNSTTNPTN